MPEDFPERLADTGIIRKSRGDFAPPGFLTKLLRSLSESAFTRDCGQFPGLLRKVFA
jgi:hypothetical protein